MAAIRNTHLDGWRAIAVAGVMWQHWAPAGWRGPFPFEIGLFYFLTLTGFLITRILLRERTLGEATAGRWRARAYGAFMRRRFTRILAPCYAAMILAWLLGAPDIRAHPWWYFGHVANFHMAWLPAWPSGTAHLWTLAIQMQFYLLWPGVVWLAPRKWLGWVWVGCAAVAPVSRWIIDRHFPGVTQPGAITPASLDYLALGALLAWLLERGVDPANRWIRRSAWLAFAGYGVLYVMHQYGRSSGGIGYFQQTLLSVAFAGLIAASLAKFHGRLAGLLNAEWIQTTARLSYGLYLFHAMMPLLVGKILPFLWWPPFDGPLQVVRLGVFLVASFAAARVCWRRLEGPDAWSWQGVTRWWRRRQTR